MKTPIWRKYRNHLEGELWQMVWPTGYTPRSKEEKMSMKLECFRKSGRQRHSFQTVQKSEIWLKGSSKGKFRLLILVCKFKYLIYPTESLVNFTLLTDVFMRINYFQGPLRGHNKATHIYITQVWKNAQTPCSSHL